MPFVRVCAAIAGMLELCKAGFGGPYLFGQESVYCYLEEFLEFRKGKAMTAPEVRRWHKEETERKVLARGIDAGASTSMVQPGLGMGYGGGQVFTHAGAQQMYAAAQGVGLQYGGAGIASAAGLGYSAPCVPAVAVTSAASLKALAVAEKRRQAICYRCGFNGHYITECALKLDIHNDVIPLHRNGYKPAKYAPPGYVPMKLTELEMQQVLLLSQVQPRPPPPRA